MKSRLLLYWLGSTWGSIEFISELQTVRCSVEVRYPRALFRPMSIVPRSLPRLNVASGAGRPISSRTLPFIPADLDDVYWRKPEKSFPPKAEGDTSPGGYPRFLSWDSSYPLVILIQTNKSDSSDMLLEELVSVLCGRPLPTHHLLIPTVLWQTSHMTDYSSFQSCS